MSTEKTHLAAELQDRDETTRLGFWIYLLSDVMLFGALFATFMILRHGTADGPTIQDIVEPGYVLIQTMLLLASSFTCAIALLAFKYRKRAVARYHLIVTWMLGAMFLVLELLEFTKLYLEGHSWQASAFLSGFFALVGTHGLHILIGLIWLTVLIVVVYKKKTISSHTMRRLGLFGLFWHFLDLVWVFIFTIVYMFGAGGI